MGQEDPLPATGPTGPTAGDAAGLGATTNPRPTLSSIAVALASHPPGFIPDPPNVINLSAVAEVNEASLTVTGENFVSGSRVMLNGRELPTDVISSTTLSAQLTAANVSKPGEYRVTVFTPAPGGGVSNSMKLYAEPEPKWRLLEKALVLGALVAAALWILWMINIPLPGRSAAQASAQTNAAPTNWQLTWFIMFGILILFTIGVGRALTGTWKSLLIDERNKQSLSRLQLMLWTWLVISALATAAAWNIHLGADDPLGIHVPEELWILLGISTGTLVGSNLIKTQQAHPDITQEVATERLNEITRGEQTAQGELAKNVSRVQARWTDMFKSEGVANVGTLDVGKIQMFFFTLIVVLAYAAAFARTSYIPANGQESARFGFPDLHGSLVALLGISSTAYLANKAAKQL